MILDFRLPILDFLKRRWRWALAIGPVALAFLVVFPYYTWKATIRREIRGALQRGTLQSEISNLKAQVAREAERALQAEGRAQELAADEERLKVESSKLKAELAAARAREQKIREDIAKLSTAEVAARIQDSGFRIQDPETARQVLDLRADRDTCREQLGLSEAQNENCAGRVANLREMADEHVRQNSNLQSSIGNYQEILRRQDELRKLEVKAARGSWFSRAASKGKWFLAGAAVGAVGGALATR